MRQLHLRALIGAVFALSNVVRWKPDSNIAAVRWDTDKLSATSNEGGNDLKQPQRRQHKVFGFQELLRLRNSSSTMLIPAAAHEKDDAEVIWSTKTAVVPDHLLPLAIESMYKRLKRNQKIKPDQNPTEQGMKETLLNFTQEELNAIDPEWQIFILEISDNGLGIWPYWYMLHEMAPLLGWNRINYVTRSTQNGKDMKSWVLKMLKEQSPNLTFDGFFGKPINFTSLSVDVLGKGCRSIQRLILGARDDIVDAIDEYMKENHPSAYEEASNKAIDMEDKSFLLSQAIAELPRPTDVRTFWNSSVCNTNCVFRNYVAEIVEYIPQRHPDAGIQVNTDVVGFIHRAGRQRVHPDFISGIASTKVIVLAQRDNWEGHFRLCEALVSGALVMTDPQVYFPHGLIDGENIVIYNSWLDLELKILYYLDPKNEEERIKIGQRGREVALTHHRTWQQAERLFLNDMKYRNDYGLSNKPW
ncbi:hypothetical protein ACHAXR_005961 [Thalassiosira sp. AJA248-18]